jgi:small subunit ribosomal protein S21
VIIFAARFTRLPVAKAFKIPDMIIVQIKDNETVDRALKRFKKKFERTGVLKELRRRTFFQKPSITKRKLKQKAVYKLATYGTENE